MKHHQSNPSRSQQKPQRDFELLLLNRNATAKPNPNPNPTPTPNSNPTPNPNPNRDPVALTKSEAKLSNKHANLKFKATPMKQMAAIHHKTNNSVSSNNKMVKMTSSKVPNLTYTGTPIEKMLGIAPQLTSTQSKLLPPHSTTASSPRSNFLNPDLVRDKLRPLRYNTYKHAQSSLTNLSQLEYNQSRDTTLLQQNLNLKRTLCSQSDPGPGLGLGLGLLDWNTKLEHDDSSLGKKPMNKNSNFGLMNNDISRCSSSISSISSSSSSSGGGGGGESMGIVDSVAAKKYKCGLGLGLGLESLFGSNREGSVENNNGRPKLKMKDYKLWKQLNMHDNEQLISSNGRSFSPPISIELTNLSPDRNYYIYMSIREIDQLQYEWRPLSNEWSPNTDMTTKGDSSAFDHQSSRIYTSSHLNFIINPFSPSNVYELKFEHLKVTNNRELADVKNDNYFYLEKYKKYYPCFHLLSIDVKDYRHIDPSKLIIEGDITDLLNRYSIDEANGLDGIDGNGEIHRGTTANPNPDPNHKIQYVQYKTHVASFITVSQYCNPAIAYVKSPRNSNVVKVLSK